MALEQGLDFDSEENSQSPSCESDSIMEASNHSSRSLLRNDPTKSHQETDRTHSCQQELKCVSFEKVFIRSYDRVIGDHPCCRSGLPISFGWEVLGEETWDFEDYQEKKHRSSASKSSFWLSPKARENLGLEEDHKMAVEDDDAWCALNPKLSRQQEENTKPKPAINRRSVRRKHPRQKQKQQQKRGGSIATLSRRPRMWMPLQAVN
eukprot:CAMPEP_0195264234 /NCGR_PEP_ID=MMETSP0706-20130129/10744_1 /TAXON_ID=33640 /ORGANISM="Asterionellopsis glacialis, Strain CCMP134" /LENGTH=206 /DNA_ID=CAMNT_0040318497 /DNA_START=35 /DNA_END=655 /DNA_ORIENTATION=-